MKHCQRHGPEKDHYCVDCWKDDRERDALCPSDAMPCSAWINFRNEKPDAEETVLMWYPGLGGTGERGPWVKCDKLRNCLVGLPAFWAHIIPPNAIALTPYLPKRCGWRGMGGGEGCVRPHGHDGRHGFSDGSGSLHNTPAQEGESLS